MKGNLAFVAMVIATLFFLGCGGGPTKIAPPPVKTGTIEIKTNLLPPTKSRAIFSITEVIANIQATDIASSPPLIAKLKHNQVTNWWEGSIKVKVGANRKVNITAQDATGIIRYIGSQTIEVTENQTSTVNLELELPETNVFVNRADAVFSPTGSVPTGAKAYSPDGTRYATDVSASYVSGTIGVYNKANDQLIRTFPALPPQSWNDLKGLCWSPNSQFLAVMYHGGMRSGVSLYRASNGVYLGYCGDGSTNYGWCHYMVFSYGGGYIYASTITAHDEYKIDLKNLENSAFSYNSGVNLPWDGYGHDLGIPPWGGAPDGFSTDAGLAKLRANFSYLQQNNVKVARIFLFCDLRSGVTFNANGVPTAFQANTLNDFQALLTTAQAYEIRLIPVIFDFTLADGIANENGFVVGEHPDLITNQANRQALLNLYKTFFQRFGANPNIWCWDIMNEPEYVNNASAASVKVFVQAFADLIHQQAPQAKVTLGCRNRGDLANWTNIGLDIYQFHYYDKMEGQFPYAYPVAQLKLDKPVLIGEVQPTNAVDKLNKARVNGYAGVLFWSLNADYSFRDIASGFRQWILNN